MFEQKSNILAQEIRRDSVLMVKISKEWVVTSEVLEYWPFVIPSYKEEKTRLMEFG